MQPTRAALAPEEALYDLALLAPGLSAEQELLARRILLTARQLNYVYSPYLRDEALKDLPKGDVGHARWWYILQQNWCEFAWGMSKSPFGALIEELERRTVEKHDRPPWLKDSSHTIALWFQFAEEVLQRVATLSKALPKSGLGAILASLQCRVKLSAQLLKQDRGIDVNCRIAVQATYVALSRSPAEDRYPFWTNHERAITDDEQEFAGRICYTKAVDCEVFVENLNSIAAGKGYPSFWSILPREVRTQAKTNKGLAEWIWDVLLPGDSSNKEFYFPFKYIGCFENTHKELCLAITLENVDDANKVSDVWLKIVTNLEELLGDYYLGGRDILPNLRIEHEDIPDSKRFFRSPNFTEYCLVAGSCMLVFCAPVVPRPTHSFFYRLVALYDHIAPAHLFGSPTTSADEADFFAWLHDNVKQNPTFPRIGTDENIVTYLSRENRNAFLSRQVKGFLGTYPELSAEAFLSQWHSLLSKENCTMFFAIEGPNSLADCEVNCLAVEASPLRQIAYWHQLTLFLTSIEVNWRKCACSLFVSLLISPQIPDSQTPRKRSCT